jgi:hypothetical protein
MFAIVLTLALAAASEPAKPEFQYTDFSRKEDKVEASFEKDRVVFTVISPRGIGGATIKLKAGEWPKEIAIRLTYGDEGFKNLENFRMSTARVAASGAIGSSGKVPFTFLDAKGDTEPLESGHEGGTLDMKVVKTDKGIELRLPPRMLVGSKTLTLSWIDAFRR